METVLNIHIQKIIYNYHTRFMFSSWVRYTYFNNELIISINVVLMNATYGYQYHLDQYLVKKLLERKYIQVE